MRKCACGKNIEFVKVEGRPSPVPLDCSAPVYRVKIRHGQLRGEMANRVIGRDKTAFLVSHFTTCPHAGEFSKAKRKRQEAIENLIEAAGEIAKHGVLDGKTVSVSTEFHVLLRWLVRASDAVKS